MAKIAVFAGHGGSDYGAVYGDLREKDFTLALSNATTQLLRQKGYTVVNNRTTDVARSITADANLANRENVDAVVELHLNSNEGIPGTGTETFYSAFDTGTGRQLAAAINQNIVDLGFYDRGIKTQLNANGQDYFGIIRLTNAPAVLVEAAFINNPQDMAKFDTDKVANAIANGIMSVFPLRANPPATTNIARDIQTTLNQRYNAGLTVDGVIGPLTRIAIVKGLQTELNNQFGAGLVVDGVFGEKTKEAAVNVRRGARGNITFLIQAMLYAKGFRLDSVDGIFGEKTENMVKSFQNSNNLQPTGVATPLTQLVLFR